jgi:hypothetical protein
MGKNPATWSDLNPPWRNALRNFYQFPPKQNNSFYLTRASFQRHAILLLNLRATLFDQQCMQPAAIRAQHGKLEIVNGNRFAAFR